MTPQELREKASSIVVDKANNTKVQFEKDVEELYTVTKSLIEDSANSGEFERLICMEYSRNNPQEFRYQCSIADELVYKLIQEGFEAVNYGVFGHPLGVRVSWEKV